MTAAVSTVGALHREIARALFGANRPSDAVALRLMGVLTTHRLLLSDKVSLGDAPGISTIEPVTHRFAAEVISSLWSGTGDDRERPSHWYGLWNGNPPYDVVFETWFVQRDKELEELLGQVRSHPWIAGLKREP